MPVGAENATSTPSFPPVPPPTPGGRPSGFLVRHRQWLALAALLAALWLAPPLQILQGIDLMPLWLHTFAETFAIVVAMLIFAVGWHNHGKDSPGNILILSCAFLAAGLIDFAHLLSYKGMPDFVTPSGGEKGINFWLAARFAAALGLLAAALRPWRPLAHPWTRHFLLLGALAFTALVYWLGLFHQALWPRTFIEGQGLTPFKIVAEYTLIAIMLVSATAFYLQSKQAHVHNAPDLFAAVVITILSELCFTLYSDATDGLNLLGHIYKVVAYAFLYRAIFISTVREPFLRAQVEIAARKQAETALREAEKRLIALNEELEQRVAQRTRQFEAANQELEAFSYSVSHDLRAPLRSVDGFSQILLRDHAEKLDETGRDYLQRVARAAKRMGELIDDLLQLSRVSRSDLKRETIDLSKLVCSVGRDIKGADPQRQVKWVIQPGVTAEADGRLMRTLLENLLRNAWKFSAKKADARIEFGTVEQEGEKALFVRDNGAGFDMQYAHKLFGAFQRLHRAEEFEGSGIGLAIVQRIVNQHGGRIWAESTPGEGATFYFTV